MCLKRSMAALVLCVVWVSPAAAQPGCMTVFLPDLGPVTETPVTGGIRTGFTVPPTTPATGAYYPFSLYSTTAGFVALDQPADLLAPRRHREWTGVTSISLVTWYSEFDSAYEGAVKFVAYKVLPNSIVPGQLPLPTWAYRIAGAFVKPVETQPMSGPVQLGEQWNVGIENSLPHPVWVSLQVEARICQ